MKNISHLIVLALFSFSVCLFSKLDAEERVIFFEFTAYQDQEQCILLDQVQELCCQFPFHDISVCACAGF